MTTTVGHPWTNRGENEKRCSGCHTTAVRTMRPGRGWDVAFFAPDGTRIEAPPPCGTAAMWAPQRDSVRARRPGLYYVFLAGDAVLAGEQGEAVGRELAAMSSRGRLASWSVHRAPDFVSLRLTSTSTEAAQLAARPLIAEAFAGAGLGEPRWDDVISIPAGETARPRPVAARSANARPAATAEPLALSLEAG